MDFLRFFPTFQTQHLYKRIANGDVKFVITSQIVTSNPSLQHDITTGRSFLLYKSKKLEANCSLTLPPDNVLLKFTTYLESCIRFNSSTKYRYPKVINELLIYYCIMLITKSRFHVLKYTRDAFI